MIVFCGFDIQKQVAKGCPVFGFEKPSVFYFVNVLPVLALFFHSTVLADPSGALLFVARHAATNAGHHGSPWMGHRRMMDSW